MFKFALLLIAVVTCHLLTSGEAFILTDKEIELLKNSPFVPIGTKDEHQAPARVISSTIVKLKEYCTCDYLSCNCCTKVGYGFLSLNACFNFGYHPRGKKFAVSASVAGQGVFAKSFTVQGIDDACSKNIGGVDELDFCMSAIVDQHPKITKAMKICTHFALKYAEIPIIKLHLHCFVYDGDELFVAHDENADNKDSLFNFEIKQPFEIISKLIMKLVDKIKASLN